jgi:MFS family permease
MLRQIHSPILLANVADASASAFVVLFTCDAMARALLISLLPLQLYDQLGDAQLVSMVYFSVALLGLSATLTVPVILHRISRRWILTTGAVLQMASVGLFAIGSTYCLVAGLALQALAIAMLDVVINLYLLDHVPRRELTVFEPRRLLFAGSAFAAGPWLGVFLHRHVVEWFPYLVAGVAMLALLMFFWAMRLTDNPGLQPATGPPPNPIRCLRRFASQPRLVLSWLLALGRNGWWVMNFMCVPIYVTSAGYRPELGGALVSLGLAPMLLVRVWGRIGQRIGARTLLMFAYGLTGALSLLAAAAAAAGATLTCMVLICMAAFSATVIDGAGNVPFLRAVHHYERSEMTSVFMTFRHVGALCIPGILMLVLSVMPLPSAFVVGGAIALTAAALSRFLPRGM